MKYQPYLLINPRGILVIIITTTVLTATKVIRVMYFSARMHIESVCTLVQITPHQSCLICSIFSGIASNSDYKHQMFRLL
jgi:hypothetical protein